MRFLVTLLIVLILAYQIRFTVDAQSSQTPEIYIPYFSSNIPASQTSIFWFGQVTPFENYADVRLGYNSTELLVRVQIIDRVLQYDSSPQVSDLTSYDSVSLFLDTNDSASSQISGNSYKFISQLSWFEPRSTFQAGFTGENGTWQQSLITFTTDAAWRGDAPNNSVDDRGWVSTFHIPFTSLGYSSAPAVLSRWKMAVIIHDKDDDLILRQTSWPQAIHQTDPSTWGKLYLGMPDIPAPPVENPIQLTIREDESTIVEDADVGGHTDCGGSADFWTGWANANFAHNSEINVQNQGDIADWPCFSKYYVSFPLGEIPSNKLISSAKLIMHQFGNAGGGEFDPAQSSFIHAFATHEIWEETTLNWNNAPQAYRNLSVTRVEPMSAPLVWPGVRWEWDVRQAVIDAYVSHNPARIILYSSDTPYHSGKYFSASEVGDWNIAGRPALEITYGDPATSTAGDLDQDGDVDIDDYTQMQRLFGQLLCGTLADINGNCVVDIFDLNSLITNFG